MRIQHNITAMNSYRNFATNNSMLSKNLEKLSSGYKVNRAGDDAAGLAISEKMRAQITGLEGATKNAKDGISLIQTAEGALTEVHSMLNRMTTLAEQSANGTYDNDVDRFQLQKEIQALKDEIDRIADSTNFNGLKLLDGSLSSNTEAAVNAEKQVMTVKGTNFNTGEGNTTATVSTRFAEAKGDMYTMSTNFKGTNDHDAFRFKFTDKDQNTHELVLATNADTKGSIKDVDTLIAALKGSSDDLKLDVSTLNGEDQNEVLRIFRETFEVGKDGSNQLTLTVKQGAQGARLDAASHATNSDLSTAIKDVTKADAAVDAMKKSDGKNAGLVLKLGGGATAGDRVQIGGKVYEFVATADAQAKTAGATAVYVGDNANLKEATLNLFNALKADGYDVMLEDDGATNPGTAGEIRFTNLEQISEGQAGGSVSTNSGNLAVVDQEASKQSTTFTLTTAATQGNTITISVSYVDGDGKNQSKELTLDAGADIATQANDILTKLKDDKDLRDLFEFELDNTTPAAPAIKITSRSTDNTLSQIGSITAKAATSAGAADAAFATNTEIVAGVNDGKSIELRDGGQNIKAGDTVTINGKTYEFAAHGNAPVGDGNTRVLIGSNGKESLENLSKMLTEDGIKNSYDSATGKIVFSDRDNIVQGAAGGLRMQIGDTADSYNMMTVSVEDMHVKAIGINDVDISTQDGAAAALDLIKKAINYVSDTRGSLGALQNRLDHTINNLGVMRENIQSAESLIRDTDVAEEMMAYTKNSILNQSAQAMLAQANQLTQGVLQLLQ